MPTSTAETLGQTGTGNSPRKRQAIKSPQAKGPFSVTRSRGKSEEEQKSFSIDRYHFRKDGAGYECREVIGKGKDRKRPYLAYLSKATLDEFRKRSTGGEDLETQILKWATEKKNEKGGKN